MNNEKEMLLVEKEIWDSLVEKLHELTKQVSMYEKSYIGNPRYYSNKELCSLLRVEEKLIRKYREQGLLSYTKVGDKYWYSSNDVIEFLNHNKHATFIL